MKAYYVIDIGTNSVRMMRAMAEDGKIGEVQKTIRTVRTGEGVNASGRLKPEAIARTVDALEAFGQQAQGAPLYCFATSAVRDAANRQELLDAARARCGIEIEVLSGDVEAQTGFAGAVGAGGSGGILDIGGGSTEVVFGRAGKIEYAHSFNIGSVRGMELFAQRADAQEAALRWATQTLAQVDFSRAEGLPFYAIGGTATSLAAVDLGLLEYDPNKVQGYRLTAARAREMLDWLFSKTVEERRSITGMDWRRADVIVYGLSVLTAFFDVSGWQAVEVSEADNLEGYLLMKLARGEKS